jgi:beta-galactosidase
MVKRGFAERVRALLQAGGTFVTTAFSGVVDETDLAFEGYPGPLRPLLGVWVEEIDALYPSQTNTVVMADGSGTFECNRLCEVVRLEGAEVVATFGDDFYAGSPAVTRHGNAYYIATDPSDAFLDVFLASILRQHGITAPLDAPVGVEVAVRERDGRRILFVLNHTDHEREVVLHDGCEDLLSGARVEGRIRLAPRDVRILAS